MTYDEHHERAVEEIFQALDRRLSKSSVQAIIHAYLDCLADQGAPLVRLSEVVAALEAHGGGHHVETDDGIGSYVLHGVEDHIKSIERRFAPENDER